MSDDKKNKTPKPRPGGGVKLTPPPRAEVPAVFAKSKKGAAKDPKDKKVGHDRKDKKKKPEKKGKKDRADRTDKKDGKGNLRDTRVTKAIPDEPVEVKLTPAQTAKAGPKPTPLPESRPEPKPTPKSASGESSSSPASSSVPGARPLVSRAAKPEPPPTPARSAAGLRIGDYTIDEEIGAGGMSVIYRSHQASLGRLVAVKVLRSEIAAQPHLVERFEREAQSLATLQHENILHIYEYRTDGEVPFMVTEFVEGVDLYDVLERHQRLPVEVAAVVAAQVARALDYAHSRGVIHRDVKPANIMFTAQGGIKLMDFGIARQAHGPDLTQAGAGVGTPAYMSPEQILCEKLDGRTDLWSLGVVLYQMVTGRKPFLQEESRSVLHKIRADKPTPPRQLNGAVPRPLERIILRCLEKRAADRYPVAQQLALALERFVAARVAMGHQAQLLYYLQGVGEFSEEQVQAALPDTAGGGYRATFPRPPRRHSDRPPLGVTWAVWVGGVSGALLLTLLIVVLAAWPGRESAGEKCKSCPSPPVPGVVVPLAGSTDPAGQAVPTGRGGLRVVAHPWAEVRLGGKVVETTPFDRPLALPVGAHEVVLHHPKLGRVTRTVQIRAGKVHTLLVDLTAKGGKR